MADRATVALVPHQPPERPLNAPPQAIMVYTHWRGSELPQRVAQGLYEGKPRWGEPSYLSKILLGAVIGDDLATVDGFGVSLTPFHAGTEAGRPLLVVDMRRQLVGFVAWGKAPVLPADADDYETWIGKAAWPDAKTPATKGGRSLR